jgi:hypothetical protein
VRDNPEQAITNLQSAVQYLTSLPNVNSHEGAWLAGQNGAEAEMIMPRKVEVGLKYHQEFINQQYLLHTSHKFLPFLLSSLAHFYSH